jgi:short-subunit dehydrogenase
MADVTIITGASAGIGADLAREAAKRGWNLVLTARREERLTALAEELTSAHRISADVVTADLAAPGGPNTLIEAVIAKGHQIDGLINNAGFG